MFLDPIDAMQSRVEDVKTDITNKGAFTFSVVVKDRYKHRHAMRAEPMTFFFHNMVKFILTTYGSLHLR